MGIDPDEAALCGCVTASEHTSSVGGGGGGGIVVIDVGGVIVDSVGVVIDVICFETDINAHSNLEVCYVQSLDKCWLCTRRQRKWMSIPTPAFFKHL